MKDFVRTLLIKISRTISRIIFYVFRIFEIMKDHIIPVELQKKGVGNLNSQLKIRLEDNLVDETIDSFQEHFKNSVLFYDEWSIREHAIKTSLSNDKNKEYYYLEFGVWKGSSANFFSKYLKVLYCFDSFEGLKEDWSGTSLQKGNFNLNKKVPKLKSNVKPIKGWVEDTLDKFLIEHNPKINFIHLDMDTYRSTKFTLEKLKPYLVKNCIVLFDQLYNYIGWEGGEYRALREVFKEEEFEYISFAINSKQSAVKIK